MTGTGTKGDPYIVYTWTEFTSTITQNGVYIELGSDIDCIDMAPLTPVAPSPSSTAMYEWNFKMLDGKEHAIKNLYLLNGITLFQGTSRSIIKNLRFENQYLSYARFLLLKSDHPMYYYLPTFINCHFSAECVNHSEYIDSQNTYLWVAVFRECSFHIRCDNANFTRLSSSADNRIPILLDNCLVELYGSVAQCVLQAQLVDTLVIGEVTIADPQDDLPAILIINKGGYEYYTADFMISNSVFDVIVHNNSNYDTVFWLESAYYYDENDDSHYCTETLFVNTSVIERLYSRAYATFKSCNSNQIHSESYLRTNGLVAEEIINSRFKTMLSANFPRTPATGATRTHIDTGVVGTRYRKTSVKWEFLNSTGASYTEYWVMGATDAHDSIMGTIFGAESTTSLVTWQDQSYNLTNFSDTASPGGMIGVKLYGYCDNSGWRQGQDTYNILIGCNNWNGRPQSGAECKIYEAKIWDTNNSILRNYVPAYDIVNEKYGMLDKVNTVFYGNAGTGDSPEITGDPMPFRFVNGVLQHVQQNNIHRLGAFCHATSLVDISIPDTVKHIGRYAFTNTQLQSVTLASDCEYYETSFPPGCIIETY